MKLVVCILLVASMLSFFSAIGCFIASAWTVNAESVSWLSTGWILVGSWFACSLFAIPGLE